MNNCTLKWFRAEKNSLDSDKRAGSNMGALAGEP